MVSSQSGLLGWRPAKDLQRITHANWRSHMIGIKPLYKLSALTLILGLAMIALAQANHQPLITQKVNNAALVTLRGEIRDRNPCGAYVIDTVRYQAEIFLPYSNPLAVGSVFKSAIGAPEHHS
jgi:hypothetical protein